MKKLFGLLLISGAYGCDSSKPSEPIRGVVALTNKIVFMRLSAAGRSSLVALDPDGSNAVALTADTAYYDCPGISPDGRQISFVRGGAVYVMNSDGTGERLLRPVQNGAFFYRCPAWSPAGDRLAFAAMVPMVKQSSPGGIYMIDVKSATSTSISIGYNYSGIEWSRDGTRLLVGSNSYTSGGPYDFRVSVLALDGTPVMQVVANHWNLSWAPDGGKFAYQCGSRWPRVCVINIDGSNLQLLTPADTAAYAPKWSPDGKMIAYSLGRTIYAMNADGSSRMPIVVNEGSGDLTWSPDSRRLAFSCPSQLGNIGGYAASDICVVNVDGSGFKRLTNLSAAAMLPSWSPM